MYIKLSIYLNTNDKYTINQYQKYKLNTEVNGFHQEYHFSNAPGAPLYKFEQKHFANQSPIWRAERYLINIMNNINFYNKDIDKKNVIELFISALNSLKNRYENFEQRIYINNKESYIQYSVYH